MSSNQQTAPTDLSIKRLARNYSPEISSSSIVQEKPTPIMKPRFKGYQRLNTKAVNKADKDSSEMAIRKAIAALSQTLPAHKPSDVTNDSIDRFYMPTETVSSSDEEVTFVGKRFMPENVEHLNKVLYANYNRKRKRSDGSVSSSSSAQSPEFLNALHEATAISNSLNKNNNNKLTQSPASNTISVISQSSIRPTHLNLPVNSNLPSTNFSPASLERVSEWEKKQYFSVVNSPVSFNGSTPNTPTELDNISPTQKRRKRKTGPGRGWKFHDLSNDGGTKKKRAYAQNKLENDILQNFQDRVCVKTVSTGEGAAEKIVIVEASEIVDIDLVLASTSLRLLFDKENGIYKLQLLPYTIEEGLLSNRKQVLCAVSKMLGDNGETLCPTAYNMLQNTSNSIITKHMTISNDMMIQNDGLNPRRNTISTTHENITNAKFSVLKHTKNSAAGKELLKANSFDKTDKLLRSINSELVRNNNIQSSLRNKCLIWHANGFKAPGKKSRNVPSDRKWCINCRNISTPL